MKITIESTTQVVFCKHDDPDGVLCRVWEGTTESGIKVQCLIARVAAPDDADVSQFEKELVEQRAPSAGPVAFPLRMVL